MSEARRYWVAITCDLKYEICGLGRSLEEAKQSVWAELLRTNNSGYGFPTDGMSMQEFFEYYGLRTFHLAPGEAEG